MIDNCQHWCTSTLACRFRRNRSTPIVWPALLALPPTLYANLHSRQPHQFGNLASAKRPQNLQQCVITHSLGDAFLGIGYKDRRNATKREGRVSFRAPPVRTTKQLTRYTNAQEACSPMPTQRLYYPRAVLKQVQYTCYDICTHRGSTGSYRTYLKNITGLEDN